MTTVSIITPCWNSGTFLPEVYHSLEMQTLNQWEWIVVDDGSTDDSVRILEEISKRDPRVILIKSTHTGQPAVGRNIGMRKAGGKYLAFLDSDDIFLPEKLEKQVALLESDRSIHVTYSDVKEFFTEDIQTTLPPPTMWAKISLPRKSFNTLLCKGNVICTSSILMRREVYETVGDVDETPELRAMEDHEYILRIAKQFDIVRTEGVLVKYRVHPGNISKTTEFSKIEALKKCLEKQGFLTGRHGRIFLSGYYITKAEESMMDGADRDSMKKYFLKALLLYPPSMRRWTSGWQPCRSEPATLKRAAACDMRSRSGSSRPLRRRPARRSPSPTQLPAPLKKPIGKISRRLPTAAISIKTMPIAWKMR